VNHPEREHLIAVDVGNSRIKFGMFAGDAPSRGDRLPECLEAAACRVDDPLPWDQLRGWAGVREGRTPKGLIAGANPVGVAKVLASWPAQLESPRVLDKPAFRLRVDVAAPDKVGIDRLLNAVAANVVRPAGRAAIIVDTGTATTVDLVGADGAFRGGAILPGFELSAIALHRYTALLPQISIEELAGEPQAPLGRNTREALRSGLFWGQLGAVKELIAQLGAGPDGQAIVVLTGGGASLLAPHLSDARWEPHLSLQGLVLAGEERVEE
jgi:type III pantothenate kinase